jgi:hypothetical protein
MARNNRDPYKFDGYTIWDFTIHYIWADLNDDIWADLNDGSSVNVDMDSWNQFAIWLGYLDAIDIISFLKKIN